MTTGDVGLNGRKERLVMSEEMLDDVLDGQQATEEQQEPATEQPPEEAQAAEPEAPPAPPTPEQLAERMKGLEAGIAEERKKRQELQLANAELRGRMAAPQQPQQQQQQVDWEKEDQAFWENPAYYTRMSAAQAAQAAANESEAKRLHASERRVAAKKPDYQEKYQAFAGMLQQEPWLMDQVSNAAEPAQAMYDLVVRRQTYGESPEEMEKRLRAKWEAEQRGTTAKAAAAGAPPTQAGATGTPPSSALPAPTGRDVLAGMLNEDVFG